MPGISILNGWDYRGKNYDFSRQGFATLDAMKSFSENYLPPLYIATNEEDGGVYLYNVANDVDDTTGKWRPLGAGDGADMLNYYTKTQTDGFLDLKADKDTTYTKDDIDTMLELKADKDTTYTITQTDALLALKADKETTYTKTQTDALLDTKADKLTTYTKTEVNDLLDTKADVADLATVATTGSYTDLIDKPIIDNALSITSENAVQNKIVSVKLNSLQSDIDTINDEVIPTLATKAELQTTKEDLEEEIEAYFSSHAFIVDQEPTVSSSVDPDTGETIYTTTYVKDGVSQTTTDQQIWYYFTDTTDNNTLKQSIVIGGVLTTIVSADSIELEDWVNKEYDLVKTWVMAQVQSNADKIVTASVLTEMKTAIDALLDLKVNVSDYETYQSQVQALLDAKADKLTTYTKTEVNDLLDTKADKATTYTKTQTDTLLDEKADVTDMNAALALKVDTSDFTDYQTTVTNALDTKVDKAQGAINANKILGTDDDGNVTLLNPSALGNSAENISYDNASFQDLTNVKLALDDILAKLYYVEPAITSFTMTPSTTQYEVGTVVNGVSFTWTTNKDITSQTLTGCTLADETVRTASYTTDISANKTFTLAISDGQKSATASKTISFLHKVYWGSATEPSGGYTSAWILALSNSKLASSANGSYSFNAGSGEYAYFAMPQSMKKNSAWVNGFNTDLEDCGNISFTNASGNTSTFSIVRFMQKSLGSFTAEIK